jgi:hypothetical protein
MEAQVFGSAKTYRCFYTLTVLAIGLLFLFGCAQARREPSPIDIQDSTFRLIPAYVVSFNVPTESAAKVLRQITDTYPLPYGSYDQVAFRSATGIEQFRPLKGSKAGEQAKISEVPTTRITFSIPEQTGVLQKVVAAIRTAHPYEEPVIQIQPGWISQAKHEGEESNPNRWWNQIRPAEQAAPRSTQ